MAIDFSDLGAQPAQQSTIDFSDLGAQKVASKPFPAGPVYRQAFQMASDALPWNKVKSGLQDLGGSIAEEGGKLGFPKTGVALGLIPALGPDVLAAGTSLQGIYESQNPIIKGLINTPSELGADYAAQNNAIGVTRRVPVEGGMKASYPVQGNIPSEVMAGKTYVTPSKLPSNTGAFLNYANAKLAGLGDQMSPQELMDWQVKLQTDMNSGKIPQFDKTTGRITTAYQQAADLLSRTKQAFNSIAGDALTPNVQAQLPAGAIKNRPDLNKAFSIATKVQNPVRAILPPSAIYILKKYAPSVLEGLGFGEAANLVKK